MIALEAAAETINAALSLIRERAGSKALVLLRTDQIQQGHGSGNGFWGSELRGCV
jgi:hypothetical protein